VFVLGNAGDNTAIIGIAVGVSVGLLCIAAVVIAILIYCYKVKKRYTKFHEFRTDYVIRFLIPTSGHRSFNV